MITSSDKERFLQRIADARAKQLPKCSCKDPNQCDTWCQAKERFTQDQEERPLKRLEGNIGHPWDTFVDS